MALRDGVSALKIVFDQQVFLLQEYGGISRYVCSLARELAAMADMRARIVAPLHFNGNLDGMGRQDLICGRRFPRIPKTVRMVSAVSTGLAHLEMRRFAPDIVHETYFSTADFRPGRARRVVTVYDMIHEKFSATLPQSHLTTQAKRSAVMRADHVLCISQSTRNDLIEIFGVAPEKTSVVYLSSDVMAADAAARATVLTAIGSRPYLLYVGSRGGYKNFLGLLRAYAASDYLVRNVAIVAFGGGALSADERAAMADLGIARENVVQIGGADAILAALYEKALAFVYPSLYEGFGIPPLEAMSLGCPVISSNTSSLPEVVGDAGEYFAPEDDESMRAAMESLLQSPSRRAELIAAGYRRVEQFSWRRCAEETSAIYRSLS